MSGVHRMFTGRGKKHKDKNSTPDGELGAVFIIEDQKKKLDKDEERKLKTVQDQLQRYGITNITDANIEYALRTPSTGGNVEDAFRLCLLLEDTYEGLLKVYDPNTKLLGAVNREGVTCYLDALLFAMFARLDSFEAMLYNSLEDSSRKKLAGLLRLWVNLLRTGRLIPIDVTKQVQQCLADCGWEAAIQLQQQDTSELFTFITGQLELPLLTLKMDMFHTGRDDPNDDHKFVNERLLEVAIIEKPTEEGVVITLEECLEHYFNNRVEVKRHMAEQRRTSLKRVDSPDRRFTEKLNALHVESVEVEDFAESPAVETSASDGPFAESPMKGPVQALRPGGLRSRADSIFNQKRVKAAVIEGEPGSSDDADADAVSINTERQRKASIRTEVLMPAWQFFKLLPWYTDNMPTSDAQVAAHFARKRPVLGICLKRYTISMQGNAERLDTYIDIPLEIAVPDFVSGDDIEEGSPLVGNFKLVLQSVVCHRGRSVHSGHYVSLVRGYASNASGISSAGRPTSSSSNEGGDPWMLFDDLAKDRVSYVDIAQALKDECPYLLFYQVQPIDPDDATVAGPPSYMEAISRENSDPVGEVPEKIALPEYTFNESENAITENTSPASPTTPGIGTEFDAVDWARSVSASARNSMDAARVLDTDDLQPRLSTSSNNRSSIVTDESAPEKESLKSPSLAGGLSGATTPNEEGRSGFLSLPRRGSRATNTSKKTRSRPPSQGPDSSNRFSLNMSKLTSRMSRNDLPALVQSPSAIESKDFVSASEGSVGSVATTSSVDVKNEKIEKKNSKGGSAPKVKEGSHGHLRKGKKGEVPDRDCIMM